MFKKNSNIPFYIISGLIACLCIFIYTSPKFERIPPNIEIPDITYWNLKWNVPIRLLDSSGIKSYKVSFIKNDDIVILVDKKVEDTKTDIEFNLPIPKINIVDGDVLKYKIEVTDNSKYKFFLGNTTQKEFEIIVDRIPPEAGIIAMSNKITYGGSAVVVFFAKDDNLANISISNGHQSFVAFPFIKDGYYVSIVPWSIHNPTFKGRIIVEDKAGNIKRSNIGFARYSRNYRTSNLTLKDSFIDNKIASVIESVSTISLDSFSSRLEMFKYANEVIRNNDENMVYSKILNLDLKDLHQINVFKPLKDAVIVGMFGDHRKYTLNKEPAGESYHLGIDLANVKNAQVFASNDGVVVLKEGLGIYGNTIVIDHGLGVSTLYSHLSEFYVKEGDVVKKGDVIARTGATGLAFGDHLHFGVLIQGVFALSTEFMDSRWLKTNINDVLSEAINIIENR
ncbi:MAG: M23 family metallopeptidase [Helicobacteraceae bacterium]|nr:M23 family metallopeptidase [Helicobacteraceae bacterium]